MKLRRRGIFVFLQHFFQSTLPRHQISDVEVINKGEG